MPIPTGTKLQLVKGGDEASLSFFFRGSKLILGGLDYSGGPPNDAARQADWVTHGLKQIHDPME